MVAAHATRMATSKIRIPPTRLCRTGAALGMVSLSFMIRVARPRPDHALTMAVRGLVECLMLAVQQLDARATSLGFHQASTCPPGALARRARAPRGRGRTRP